jgi:DNA polymerase III subunit delta
MSATVTPPPPVTLVVGSETLLSDRSVAAIGAAARAIAPEADVSEISGSELTPAALIEHTSPSLFASRRVLVVRAVHDVNDQTAARLLTFATHPEPEIHLVLVHPGGPKGKRLLDELRAAGANEVACPRITRPDDQVAFVRSEAWSRRSAPICAVSRRPRPSWWPTPMPAWWTTASSQRISRAGPR